MSDCYSVFRHRVEQLRAERDVIAAARAAAVRIPDFPNAIGYCPSCHSPVDFCDEQRAAEGRRCVGGDLRDALAAYDALHYDEVTG